MESKFKSKFFYGWIIVAAGFLIYGFPMQLVNTFSSYYQVPVCTELNASYTLFSLSGMAGSIGGMLFSIFLAAKLAQGNTRRWMMVGGAISGAAVFCMGFITSVVHLIILQFITGFAFSCMTYVPVNVLINHWFVAKKGTATSIALVGQGVGSLILTPIISPIIQENWRMGYHVEGVLVLLLSLTLPLLMKKPAEIGGTPLMPTEEDQQMQQAGKDREDTSWPGVTKAQAIKTMSFVLYAFICLCCGLLASGVVTQAPTFFVESGHDYQLAMMVYSGVHIVGPLIVGWLFDKMGIIGGSAVSGAMVIISLALWVVTPGSLTVGLGAMALFSVGCCICTLMPPLVCSRIFGSKEYGGIYGFGNTFFSAGALLGTILGASIRDLTGSYSATWIFFAGLVLFQILAVMAGVKSNKKLMAQYPG